MLVAECTAEIAHTLKRAVSAGVTAIDIVNQAGEHFCNMHPWRSMNRYTSALNYVAGQSYVDLPVDFGELLAIAPVSGNGGLTLTGLDQILDWRATGGGGLPAYGAISYSPFVVSAAPLLPRLEVFPTPSANAASALSIFYRATWVEAQDDQNFIDVQVYQKPLFKQLVRAFARGIEEEDNASMSARLAEIEAGPVAIGARKADGRMQTSFGPMRGGALSMARRQTWPYPLARSIT